MAVQYIASTDPTLGGSTLKHEGRRQTGRRAVYAGSRLKLKDVPGRSRLICQPWSRTGENPPYGILGGSRKRRHHSKPGPRLDPTRQELTHEAQQVCGLSGRRCGELRSRYRKRHPPLLLTPTQPYQYNPLCAERLRLCRLRYFALLGFTLFFAGPLAGNFQSAFDSIRSKREFNLTAKLKGNKLANYGRPIARSAWS